MNDPFCHGDKVRTHERSRARLHLKNETFVAMNEQTTLSFSQSKADSNDWLELVKGVVYFISRVPNRFQIRTPFVNATIEGTEFSVAVTDSGTQIDVVEGHVLAENDRGSLRLGRREGAWTAKGSAPVARQTLKPEDAVQWTLYYPPILDLDPAAYRSSRHRELIEASLQDYRAGRVESALTRLETLDEAVHDRSSALVEAGLLIGLGRTDRATARLDQLLRSSPKDADALALRAIIALSGNDKASAQDFSVKAVDADPHSATALLARSFVRQAEFDLDGALEDAKSASSLRPNDVEVLARIAELQLATGDRDASDDTIRLAAAAQPENPRVLTVQGFSALARNERDDAARSFEKAIAKDSADPLPRFGLGLAKINRGDLDAGVQDLSIAATLNPRDAILRSYLGKAYYEQKRSEHAARQFELAKEFDPKDPTPYFYDAVKKQAENRPVEALIDMQKAIELNGNRAVYRSRELLDQDLAARSAAQGRIYQDLGFQQRALIEGWNAVNADPGDYSSHRFLADTYSAIPRYEAARVSELLQSQLLQPNNVTPLQPHLAEANLLSTYGIGPSGAGFNEFNPLFQRDRLALQASGLIGSHNTGAEEVTQSGLWKNFSYSLGQFHFASDGFRRDQRIRSDLYNVFAQAALTPDLNVQVEARYHDFRYDNIVLARKNTPSTTAVPIKEQATVLRLGGRYSPTRNSDLLVSLIYKQRNLTEGFTGQSEGYIVESQYQYRGDYLKSILGLGYYDINEPSIREVASKHATGYWYNNIRFPSTVTWVLGLSFDVLNDGPYRAIYEPTGDSDNWTRNQVNPKFGLIWNITPDTSLRLAGFRTLKRKLLTDQTIEPTQVAGFNQMYDDYNATDSSRFGVGLDQRFSHSLFGGIEASTRHLRFPNDGLGNTHMERTREDLYRAYLNWAPIDSLALSLGYEYSVFDSMVADRTFGTVTAPNLQTHRVPFKANYFHPSGLFAGMTVTFISQTSTGTYINLQDEINVQKSSSGYALVDLGIGFRLPNRLGLVRLDVRNLFNQAVQYQGLADRTSLRNDKDWWYYWPERSFMGQITLAF